MNPEFHYCPDCGYKWRHGQHGGHSCKQRLLGKIRSLEGMIGELNYDINRQKGLKDHEICGLVNALRNRIHNVFKIEHGCLREVVSGTVVKYLEEEKLRVDIKPELRG